MNVNSQVNTNKIFDVNPDFMKNIQKNIQKNNPKINLSGKGKGKGKELPKDFKFEAKVGPPPPKVYKAKKMSQKEKDEEMKKVFEFYKDEKRVKALLESIGLKGDGKEIYRMEAEMKKRDPEKYKLLVKNAKKTMEVINAPIRRMRKKYKDDPEGFIKLMKSKMPSKEDMEKTKEYKKKMLNEFLNFNNKSKKEINKDAKNFQKAMKEEFEKYL